MVAGRTFHISIVQEACVDMLGIAPRLGVDNIDITLEFKWLEDNFKLSKRKKKFLKDHEVCTAMSYLYLFFIAGQIFTHLR